MWKENCTCFHFPLWYRLFIIYECHMRQRKKWFRLQMENNFLKWAKKERNYCSTWAKIVNMCNAVHTDHTHDCANKKKPRRKNRSNQRIETEGDADGHYWVDMLMLGQVYKSSFIISQSVCVCQLVRLNNFIIFFFSVF